MILREGDKVKKTKSGIIYEVKKIQENGFVILSSEDGLTAALMNVKNVDLYFSSMSPGVKRG